MFNWLSAVNVGYISIIISSIPLPQVLRNN